MVKLGYYFHAFCDDSTAEVTRVPFMTIINIAIEIFCSLLSLIILICILVGDNLRLRVNRAFIWVLLSNIAVMLSDALAFYSIGRTEPPFYALNFIGNFLTFQFSYIVIMCFSHYINEYFSTKIKIGRSLVRMVYGICGVAIALTCLSLLNDMYFIIDDDNIYHRQGMYWLSQVFGMLGMLVNAVVIFKHRKSLNRMERFALSTYIVLPVIAIAIQTLVYGYVAVYISSTATILIIYIGMQAQYSKVLKEKELQLTESRVNIMLSQIQPHFLYNTLATIENVIHKDAGMAGEMISDFSSYLRENMNALKQKELIPFERELKHIRVYLDFEKARFKDRLSIVFELEATDFHLPLLTIQPLVENAVRHGVTKKPEGGTVRITARRTPENAEILVADDGVGFDPTLSISDGRTHIGLENVKSRLAAQCGGTLTVQSAPGSGTTVTVRIPIGIRSETDEGDSC